MGELLQEHRSEILSLVGCWAAYFFLHSLLASTTVKRRVHQVMSPRAWRLVYVVVATVGLLPVAYFGLLLSNVKVFPDHAVLRYAAFAAGFAGVVVLRQAFRQVSFRSFVGLEPQADDTLITTGIYAYVRHPLYSATLLLLVGYVLIQHSLGSVVHAVCIVAYLPLGIYWEEKKLIGAFGQAYRDYRAEVSALIPRLL